MEIKELENYLLNLKNIFSIALKNPERLSQNDLFFLKGEMHLTNELLKKIRKD